MSQRYRKETVERMAAELQELREQNARLAEENVRLREGLGRIERHSNSYMGWAAAKGEECFRVVVKPGVIARDVSGGQS